MMMMMNLYDVALGWSRFFTKIKPLKFLNRKFETVSEKWPFAFAHHWYKYIRYVMFIPEINTTVSITELNCLFIVQWCQ